MKVLMTPENKRVVINTETDECLYSAPVNPPNTGTAYTTGTDMYRHIARSGKAYYYTYTWSLWQGACDQFTLITEDEAKQMLLEAAGWTGYSELSDFERQRIMEIFPGIFEEDA